MTYDVRALQRRLTVHGFYRGRVDGVVGPQTEAAIVAFKRSRGLKARPFVGPITLRQLEEAPGPIAENRLEQPPWLNELSAVMGLHEVHDNKELTAWLGSDGRALGDPARFPWCGDAAETAILRALPDEPLIDDTWDNPYWARNWVGFGVGCGRVLGAAVPMTRGSGGHICFLIGVSADGQRIRCRGGNQGNRVSDAWFDARRVLGGYRWPKTWPAETQISAPVMDDNGAVISQNEA